MADEFVKVPSALWTKYRILTIYVAVVCTIELLLLLGGIR